MNNFTTDGGNNWNVLCNNIFFPMGILLLLPGALLTQLRAIMAAGNPILGNINPLEGIQRSVIAIFLIPGTYLVVNYSIDLSNSITFTINSEYFRLFGSDMYKDAICAEIRAFPVRGEQENRNAMDLPVPAMTALVNPSGLFAQFEGMMENKIEDPCSGIFQSPANRADEAMSSGSIAARLGLNSSNAMLTASWNILCAFQMAYLYYLWFVGPVAAGLWVWPMKQLRGALPSWVEGVITLAFWSLFWNTAILLIACFKGVGETGCILMTALHFLATASVKHAFDFAGLVRAAGQEAASMAEKAMKSGGAGGGGGGGGGGGCGASKGGGAQGQAAPNTADGIGATSSNVASNAGVSGASVSPVSVASSSTGFNSDSSSEAGRVRSGGLGETLSPRKDSKDGAGIMLASYHGGSPFGDKTSEKGADNLPPSEKKDDVAKFGDSLYASAPGVFCSTDVDASQFDSTDETLLAMGDDTDLDLFDQSGDDLTTQAGDDLTNLTASDNSTKIADAADANGLPPSAAALAEREAAKQAKQEEMKQLLAAHADANRQTHAEQVLSSLSAAVASASHVGGGVLGAGASVLNAGANVLNAAGMNLDVNNALTNIAAAANSTSVASNWVNEGDNTLARNDLGDIYSAGDIYGSIDAIDASVDNSLTSAVATNFDVVSNPALAAPAVGNVDQYGNVTTYGGVVPAGSVDQSTLVSANNTANAYTANAYTATDAYGAPLVTNTSGVPAMVGNQIDASSNPVYSAQAMTGNPVVAAVENYNTIPTGVHATVGSSEFYAAPAVSGNYVASSTSAYSADYSTQATPVASNSNYSVDYSQSTPVTQQQQQGTPVFASVLPSSTPVDYAAPAQTITGTQSQSGGNVEYYSAQAAPSQPATLASANSYVDQSSFSAAHAQFASTQYATNSAQYESNSQYAANSTQYAANTTQYDSNSTQYAANNTQYAANSTQYDSSSTQYAANSTQYAPQQGQPSSFIQPSAPANAPANEYYAAPSQSAPLIAALITPNHSSAIEVQGQQQSYTSPTQYYLANANTQPEHRSVENIAPVERAPQQSSDVVYSRSNSEAYTTVTPYHHVENSESRPVSFAPASSQNVQHGPQAVTQYEAVLSQQQVHNKVQQANGLISRMNTILSSFDAPHAVNAGSSNEVKTVSVAQPVVQNQEPVNEVATKKSLADLLPVQRKAKAAPKEEMVVAPPPMSNSWFDV